MAQQEIHLVGRHLPEFVNSLTLAGILDPKGPEGNYIFCPPAGEGEEEIGQVLSQTVFLFENPEGVSLEQRKSLIDFFSRFGCHRFLNSGGSNGNGIDPDLMRQRAIYHQERGFYRNDDLAYQEWFIVRLGKDFTGALEFDLNRRNGNKLPPVEY